MPEDRTQRQYDAWGLVVSNRNTVGAHIANGVVQLLRIAADAPPPASHQALREYRREVSLRLRALPRNGAVSEAGCALCIRQSSRGPLSLEEGHSGLMTDRVLKELSERGRAHALRRFDGATSARPLPSGAHDLIAATLNADGRLYLDENGRGDPTTPGLEFAGRSSPHTLNNMHAATFLGLLCRSEDGRRVVRHLHALLAGTSVRESLPHLRLAQLLGVTTPLTSDQSRLPDQLDDLFPCPVGAGWNALAEQVGRVACNLTSWHKQKRLSGSALWMSVVDLIGLVFVRYLLQWGTNPNDPLGEGRRPLLVVAPLRRRPAHRPTVSKARRALQMACSRLDHEATLRDLVHESSGGTTILPSEAVRALGAATGWLRPARGRGARWPCPGPRQLATLVYSAMSPERAPLAWPEFHEEVEASFGLLLGGVDEARAAARMAMPSASTAVRLAGAINQEHLLALGLARQDSDDVVVVDGGVQ